MKTIYAIRDRIAQDLAGVQMYTLFVMRTDEQAIRYFADAVFDKTSIIAKHPADYELIACGTVDDRGRIETDDPNKLNVRSGDPRIVITGDALIAAMKPELVKEA